MLSDNESPEAPAPATEAPEPAPEAPEPAPEAKDDTHDFKKIIVDFLRDLLITFPELEEHLDSNLQKISKGDTNQDIIDELKIYCTQYFPARFFDILYQNEDIFTDNELELYFLPGINFSALWKENITDKTRETIWKYLQLLLFSIIINVNDGTSFGDTAKLFEAIDEKEFQRKLEETVKNMQNIFETGKATSQSQNMEENEEENEEEKEPHRTAPNMPDPKEIHDHVASMMDGKLGNLAKQIAEETAEEMDIKMDDASSVNDVFQKLFKNPTKLMQLVKNVGTKIDEKLKSGDIKESELIAEATEIINKMKNTPGMGNMQQMFGKMGGMGSGAKMNTSAMQAHLAKSMRLAQQRERMRAKQTSKEDSSNKSPEDMDAFLEQTQMANEAAISLLKSEGLMDGLEMFKYSTGEKYKKSAKPTGKPPKKKKKRKGGK